MKKAKGKREINKILEILQQKRKRKKNFMVKGVIVKEGTDVQGKNEFLNT